MTKIMKNKDKISFNNILYHFLQMQKNKKKQNTNENMLLLFSLIIYIF